MYIEGIFNYCDRWCEHCPMTQRCFVYASTQQLDTIEVDSDGEMHNGMIRQLEASFQLTIDLLNNLSAQQGFELTDDPEVLEALHARMNHRVDTEQFPLSKLAKEYLDLTHKWMETIDPDVLAIDEDLQQAQMLQLPDRNPEQELKDLKNALDVVHWYYFQINVKLVRAQKSRIAVAEDPVFDEPMPKDSDGSAKVALIGIDRSIGAWRFLLPYFPAREETILNLSILNRLRNLTEKEFPEARNFFRPGLDDHGSPISDPEHDDQGR